MEAAICEAGFTFLEWETRAYPEDIEEHVLFAVDEPADATPVARIDEIAGRRWGGLDFTTTQGLDHAKALVHERLRLDKRLLESRVKPSTSPADLTRPRYFIRSFGDMDDYDTKLLRYHPGLGGIRMMRTYWTWRVGGVPHLPLYSGAASSELAAARALEDAIRQEGYILIEWEERPGSHDLIEFYPSTSPAPLIVASIEPAPSNYLRVSIPAIRDFAPFHTRGLDHAKARVHEHLVRANFLLL
jgi:hypothetical protein